MDSSPPPIISPAPQFATHNFFQNSENNLLPKTEFGDIWRNLKSTLTKEFTERGMTKKIITFTIVVDNGDPVTCDASLDENFFECLNKVEKLIKDQTNFSIGLLVSKEYIRQDYTDDTEVSEPEQMISDSIYSYDDWVGNDVLSREEKISLNVQDGVLQHLTYNGTSKVWDVGYRGIGGTPAMETASFQYDFSLEEDGYAIDFSPVTVINYAEAEPMDSPVGKEESEVLTTKNVKKVLDIHNLRIGKTLFSSGIVIDYFQNGFNNTNQT
ncbi:MAG: hypothetical protein ACMG57_04305 [Candidatus Dojkabacteria bacterium]